MKTADWMPVVITYAAATSACASDKQWQQALGLLAMQTPDLPGVITYTAAINACAKDVQWQQAFGLLQWQQALSLLAMQTADWIPVFFTYAAAPVHMRRTGNCCRHSACWRGRRQICGQSSSPSLRPSVHARIWAKG
jgi:hypothetical protein